MVDDEGVDTHLIDNHLMKAVFHHLWEGRFGWGWVDLGEVGWVWWGLGGIGWGLVGVGWGRVGFGGG